MRKVQYLSILAGLMLSICGCHTNATRDKGDESQPQAAVPATVAEPDDKAGTGPIAAPAPTLQPKAAGGPVLVCFGDSLTAGLGTDQGQSYPDYLQVDLDKLHYRYRVANQGISGNTTKDGVERLSNVIALHPVVVVVEFGGNDGLRGLPIEDTRANLDEIVSTLQHAGIKVVLAGISLPPDYGPDYDRQFNQTYAVLAQKYHVRMLPFLLKDVYGVPGMMQADHTHATASGNQIVARNVLSLVVPLLNK